MILLPLAGLLPSSAIGEDDVYSYTADPIYIQGDRGGVDSSLFTTSAGAGDPGESIQEGYDAFNEGDFETSLARFKEVTRGEPLYANALYGRALCAQELGDIEQAIYEYNRLIAYAGSLPEGDPERRFRRVGLESLVRLVYENPPAEEPTVYLQRILSPQDNKDALFILGGLHREYAEYEEARRVFGLLYDQAPDVRENLKLLYARAEVNELQAPIVENSDELYARAMELYEEVVEIGERELAENPDNVDVAYHVVRALGRLGLYHQKRAEQYKYGGGTYLPAVSSSTTGLLIDESESEQTDRSYIYSRNRITRFIDNYIAVIALLYEINVPFKDPDHRLDLQITIDPDGSVARLELLQSNLPDDFTDELLEMIAAWRFPPGRKRVVAVYPLIFGGGEAS